MSTPRQVTLETYVETADEIDEVDLILPISGLVPPAVRDNLRRLNRLSLLRTEVLLSLIGQAPIDPFGVYGALQGTGVWAFNPLDFTAVQILAKKGSKPVALMRIDLLSDDITMVALKKEQLVVHTTLEADFIVSKLKEPGVTEDEVFRWLKGYIDAAISDGMKNAED